ncbi:hypothetical protein ALP75_202894 [Pseudomonas syringae pv. actinidiae]|nr:hypothetical protein ALP75_202894 [Pseudomonas syringae pv. actinidiae]
MLTGLAFAERTVRAHRFDHLRVDPQHRIEGHHRVLKNHRDPVALDFTQLTGRELCQVTAFEQHLAATDAPRFVHQTENRKAGDRLARPRLADQPQNAPWLNAQRDVAHRRQHTGAGVKRGTQVAHVQGRFDRGCHARCFRQAHRCNLGFRTSRRRSPTRLIATMVISRASPGNRLIQYSLLSMY